MHFPNVHREGGVEKLKNESGGDYATAFMPVKMVRLPKAG